MIELRPYQQIAIDRVRHAFGGGKRAVLLVAPCGSGKTITFADITHGAMKRGNTVMILAHRTELIEQISGALKEFDVPHGFIAAGWRERRTAPVQVASVQTLIRRVTDIPEPKLIVMDEAHHCVTGNTWGKILATYPRTKLLGVTATPLRLDGHGLANTFDWMVQGPTTQELIDAGHLVKMRVFAPPTVNTDTLHRRFGEFIRGEVGVLMDKPSITGDVVEHYRKHAVDAEGRGKRAIVFCISVEHGHAMARAFSAADYPSVCLDGNLDAAVRRDFVRRYRDGSISVLTSCDVVSEGFDLPAIEVGILLRPTASLGLHLQQIGRCLRPHRGKTHALILDHVGNTLRHGLPTDEREWSLTDGVISAKKPSTAVRICPACWAAQSPRARVCSECAYAWPVQAREVSQIEGELQEITSEQYHAKIARMDQGQRATLADLIALGRSRGYKAPERWAEYVLKGREKKRATG